MTTKSFVFIFILIINFSHVFSQNMRKVERRILEGEFEKAEESIKKYIKNNPQSSCGYYYYAFLILQQNTSLNASNYSKSDAFFSAFCKLDTALILRNTAESIKEIDDIKFTEEKNELKDPYFYQTAYTNAFLGLKALVDDQLYNNCLIIKDVEKLNFYLDYIFNSKFDITNNNKLPEYKHGNNLKKYRDQVAFDKALEINSENSFEIFQNNYPKSHLYNKAQEFKIIAFFNEVNNIATEESYNSFIQKYTENKKLLNICAHKKDSIQFHQAIFNISENKIQQVLKNKKSIYFDFASYLLDSIRANNLLRSNSINDIENYIKYNSKSCFYNDLICKLTELEYNSIKNNLTITNLSKFFVDYLAFDGFNVCFKNKKTGELKELAPREADYFSEKDWLFVKSKKRSELDCSNDLYFIRDSLYNKVNRLKKSVLKISTKDQPLDVLVFKTSTGKILKHQMQVNDPVQGSVYVNINVNISPLESILKAVTSIQTKDQFCFFAFNNSFVPVGYMSYFPGFLTSDYVDQLQSTISSKIYNSEISYINSITKNTYSELPISFYSFDKLWNYNPENESKIDVHRINVTLNNGNSISFIFTKNMFYLSTEEAQIDLNYMCSKKWKQSSTDKFAIISDAKDKILKRRNKIYSYTGLTDNDENKMYSTTQNSNSTTSIQNRDPRSKDVANVYWNGKYPLYCLTSDVEILPKYEDNYEFWCATNENPNPIKKQIKKGETLTMYKFANYNECLNWCNIKKGILIEKSKNYEVFTVVEEMPEFPGGMGELMKYLQSNLIYPNEEKIAGISGKVFVKFVVQEDGAISNVEVLRSVNGGDGLSKEAVRVIQNMPKWKPGKQNGKTVPVYFNLPINFHL
jgi:TonB family protein